MKRDLDLVREILFTCELHEHGDAPEFPHLLRDGYTEEQIGFHVRIMGEAGLLATHDDTLLEDTSPQSTIEALTWEGYEFLELARSDARWIKAKALLSGAKLFTFEAAKKVMAQLAADALGWRGAP